MAVKTADRGRYVIITLVHVHYTEEKNISNTVKRISITNVRKTKTMTIN